MSINYDLGCSLVLYKTSPVLINKLLSTLSKSNLKIQTCLIDNSPDEALKQFSTFPNVFYHFNNKNIGYGAAHNIAIQKSLTQAPYHLILNPDVEFEPEILSQAFNFMQANKDVGLLSPKIFFPDGTQQVMTARLPTPFDLLFARRLPGFFKKVFKKKIDYYFLRDINFDGPKNIPNLPGSFMFVRTEALKKINGFDEHFFMYVEDVDITRRIHQHYKTLFYPNIQIIHALERGSNKSMRLLIYHIKSAIYYFNKWGWFTDKERVSVNSQIK